MAAQEGGCEEMRWARGEARAQVGEARLGAERRGLRGSLINTCSGESRRARSSASSFRESATLEVWVEAGNSVEAR